MDKHNGHMIISSLQKAINALTDALKYAYEEEAPYYLVSNITRTIHGLQKRIDDVFFEIEY